MKIVTCASFYGSGSSAVTDLLSEYDSVESLTDYEFRFLQDPDGISDLEYHLVENHNRHNSGHALKRFERLAKFNAGFFLDKRYEKFFEGKYWEYTKEYIDNLIDLKYKGHWFYDLYDRGRIYYYLKQMENKIIRKLSHGKRSVLENEEIYCSYPTEEEFLEYTKQYTNKLFSYINKKNKPFLMVDQLVPSTNTIRHLRYFDDIQVLVVDRDPRDIFTLEKYYWKTGIIPTDDVNNFCDWFLYTRLGAEDGKSEPEKIKYIKFEDMIFNYKNTVNEIETFLGLKEENHKKKFEKFNPKRSVNNTQVWKKRNVADEIKIIEKKLGKFLFPFEMCSTESIFGKKTKIKKIF